MLTHSTISVVFFSVSARPGGGVPRKVRWHLTHAISAVEAHSATLQAPSRHCARGCAHLGSTATTGTHGVWSAVRENSKPSRTAHDVCPVPPRQRPWWRVARRACARSGSSTKRASASQVAEAQVQPLRKKTVSNAQSGSCVTVRAS